MDKPIETGDLVMYKSMIGWVVRQNEMNKSFWYVEWSDGHIGSDHENTIIQNRLAVQKILNRVRIVL